MNNRLSKIKQTALANKDIYEMAIMVENSKTGVSASCFLGDLDGQTIDQHTPYFLASATKLYITALIMQLVEKNQLNLSNQIADFFAPNYLDGLHIYKGKEYTNEITIENLLAHTSGLGDYFEQKQQNGAIFAKEILGGTDKSYNVDDVINMVRENIAPKFAPSTPNKAFYSDSNFQLLGAIIENITGLSLAKAVEQNIATPLGLKNTFIFDIDSENASRKIISLRNGSNILHIPNAMTSVRADGAMVSSANDGLIFIKAFFNGELFSKKSLALLTTNWQKIFFPLQYGTGIMLYTLPSFLSLFQKHPDIIGHSGISGAFLFAEPSSGIYISGTVNQLHSRSLPYKILLRAIAAMR